MSQNAEGYGATIGCFLDDCMSSDKSGLLRGQLGPARFGQLGRASSQYIIYICITYIYMYMYINIYRAPTRQGMYILPFPSFSINVL